MMVSPMVPNMFPDGDMVPFCDAAIVALAHHKGQAVFFDTNADQR